MLPSILVSIPWSVGHYMCVWVLWGLLTLMPLRWPLNSWPQNKTLWFFRHSNAYSNADTQIRHSDVHCASFDVWVRDLGHHKVTLSRLDAFDTWALSKILRIPYTRHVSNADVRRTTGCSPLSHLVTTRRLRLFGHIARSSLREDHYRALAACIRQVPPDWKRPAGDIATLGSVQLRQTLALSTLASRLPGERPLLEMNGVILWTQQCSSGVCSERSSV